MLLGRHSSNELLINLVIMVEVAGRLSFKILADILSYPGALLQDRLIITDFTSLSVTDLTLKQSEQSYEVVSSCWVPTSVTSSCCSSIKWLALRVVNLPTDVKYLLNLLAIATRSSVLLSALAVLFRDMQRFITFQIALVFPWLLRICSLTYIFSASLSSFLTSCLKNRQPFQQSLSFDLIAFLLQ